MRKAQPVSLAEINHLTYEIAANRNMAQLIFDAAAKAAKLSRSRNAKKIGAVICTERSELLIRLGQELAMIAKLKPELLPIERMQVLKEHGLIPRKLFEELTIGEAIEILSIDDETAL